ncbi:MAG: DUF1826 domain-containing protein [Gammaproteobacteria bacterium]|nr:DUF1826 domain-containing protein [Gammaproteobacteria bacterium]NIR84032.1 DUF1826 domain-containing protein [Gammaproteobacteria bacterium]NIR89176.1 DUF1826 domain-containing protein [Gammaproteobacteria bacterium]NIU04978.1 DUF1826 domain-containing protein [Gammaproteobacteria bacterium]NIV52144.1 DUF1826 domain-containing protein [Gammaproteobacteria bacterium]
MVSIVPDELEPRGTYVLFVEAPVHLRAIHRPRTKLWVWRRAPEAPLERYIERHRHRHHIGLDEVLPARGETRPRICSGLQANGLPCSPALDAWAADIAGLMTLFATEARATALRVRLESVAETRERLFHFDSVNLRLLCTYAGPGTQWLHEDNVDRAQLRLQGRSVTATNRAIVKDARRVRTLRPWWVAVLKGEAYPGNANGGLVHRPPPASYGGEARVRLRIDPA